MKRLLFMMIVLLFSSMAAAGDMYECSYRQSNAQGLIAEKNCLTYMPNIRQRSTGGDALVSKKVIQNAAFDKHGLGFLYSSVGVFYFTKSGLVRRSVYFDNGPDYFKDGLARTQWNGKIGFFDSALSIVIEPRFDFALPFNNGRAAVCLGCTQKKAGEHTAIIGGKWGTINKNGEIVIDIIHSMSELKTLLGSDRN